MSGDPLHGVLAVAAGALARVGRAVRSDRALSAVGARLGWRLDSVPPPLAGVGARLGAVSDALAAARRAPDDPRAWLDLASAIATAARDLEALESATFGGSLDALDFGRVFAQQILTWALVEELTATHPRWLGVARALGALRSRRVPATADRPAYVEESFAVPPFGELLTSPSTLLRAAWGWGDPAFDGRGLLDELAAMFGSFGISAGWTTAPPSSRELVDGRPGSARWHMVARLLRATTTQGHLELGLRFVPLGLSQTEPAIAIVPYLQGAATTTFELGAGFRLTVEGVGDTGGRGIVISPTAIDVVADALGNGGASTSLAVTIDRRSSGTEDAPLGDAARFQGRGWRLRAGASASESAGSDLWIEIELIDARIGLAARDSGLLGSAGGALPLAPVPLRLGVSARRGVYVGPVGLSHTTTLGATLGPVELRELAFSLAGIADGLGARASATVAVRLGPVTIALRGLGVELAARFPGRGGNLGPVDLGVGATAPTGAAVAIDTPVMRGAGVLEHVAGRDYRGALALDVFGIRVTALGVVDDTPQNRGSFVAIAGARFPAVQLGWGFTLDGLGGVVAIHRRVDDAQIRRDLSRGSASMLLDFDVAAADLDRKIDTLATAFPAARGRHVIGPTFRIGWGTPSMLRADVAVLLEAPAPVRIVLLGALQIGLPTLSERSLDLRLDLIGVLDLQRRTFALDGSLHDSKLAGYELTGDMALRMGLGDQPHFLFAVGGFHPRFRPPPSFPALRRMTLTIGDNPRLRLEAYVALTSNTAQLGAHVDLHYKVAGLKIAGYLHFDALLELRPLHLEAEIQAGVGISYRGHNLASARLNFLLSAPHPWHAKGKASISILWWDVSVGFDVTWGERRQPQLPPPPDVPEILRTALRAREAWSGALPAGERTWIELRDRPGDDGIRVHPFAAVVIRQRAVPLDHAVTRFGTAPLGQTQRFRIERVHISGANVEHAPVRDQFAPGHFTNLRKDEQLAAPSFEPMVSGARFGDGAVALGAVARASMEHATLVQDPLAPPTRPRASAVTMPLLDAVVAHRTPPVRTPTGRVRTRPVSYVLASTRDLSITAEGAALAAGRTTYAGLREALREARARGERPALQIVPRLEAPNRGRRVVVVREDVNMRNVDFVDTLSGRQMTRAVFVSAIRAGEYPDYAVRMIRGIATPVARPNAQIDDNLG